MTNKNKKVKNNNRNLLENIKKNLKNIISKFENFSNKKTFYIIVLFIFVLILLLNFMTPLLADDFTYSFGVNKRIENLNDIFEYQIQHWLKWGGRSVVHTIAQVFLIFPKSFFNIFNALIYVVFTLLVYKHIIGKEKIYKPILYLFNTVPSFI